MFPFPTRYSFRIDFYELISFKKTGRKERAPCVLVRYHKNPTVEGNYGGSFLCLALFDRI